MRGNNRRNSNFRGGRKPPDSSSGSIHVSAREGNIPLLEEICDSNPLAVNSRDKHSRTPLHLASWSGQTEAVSFLCNLKADVGAAAMDDMGAIHFASQKGHLEIVRILLMAGVSISACTRKGFTPLHYAVQGSHSELVKYLLRKGSNPSAKTKAGKLPLDFATNDEIKSLLVEKEKAKGTEDATAEQKAEDDTAVPEQSPAHDGIKGGEVEERTDGGVSDSEARVTATKKHSIAEIDDDGNVPPEPKRVKVNLNHLLASDDNQEEGDQPKESLNVSCH